MKIAITTTGNLLESDLDRRFGRAKAFLIYDLDEKTFKVVDNTQNLNAAQGAGIQAGQNLVNSGATTLITGHCGPKAFRLLQAAGVKIYNTKAGTVEEALELYSQDKLQPAESADVEGHWA